MEVRYNQAMSLYEKKEYQKAYELFQEIRDYRDSGDLAKNVLYDQTVDLHESEDHVKALEMFTKLGDYKETSSYPTKIHLNPVIEAMKKVRSVIS